MQIAGNKERTALDGLYKKIIEQIKDYGIIILDKNGIIQNWNKEAEKIKQYRENEIVGKHFSIFYLQEDLDDNLPVKMLTEALDKGGAAQEGWRKRKDGTKFWGSISITPLYNEEGNLIGYCKMTRDLTEKKLAEDELKISEERYHKMIAEVEDYAIILLDADGIIQNWNIGAEKIKGYKRQEILGHSFRLFYTEEDREKGLPDKLLNIVKIQGKATHEGWRVRKDGTKFWGLVVITALHDKTRNIIGFSKVTRDLTQQKIAQEQLNSYTHELERQNRELEQFAYVASHDLQEPLRKILTFSELIKENIDDKEFLFRYLTKLEVSANRMSELIRSLLEYSRISKLNDESMTEEVDLNLVISDVLEDFDLVITEKKAKIQMESLPMVKGNRLQLGQLLANLISNSLKFCTECPVIKISHQTVSRDNILNAPDSLTGDTYIQLIVEDNGIGFEQKYSNLIFTIFQRLHQKSEYSGTGIGLAICNKIIESHNGFITAISQLGKGATFHIYLPN